MGSRHLTKGAAPLLSLLLTCLHLNSIGEAAPIFFRRTGAPEGYDHVGYVDFTDRHNTFQLTEQTPALEAQIESRVRNSGELTSLLVLPSGELYTKKIVKGQYTHNNTLPAAHTPRQTRDQTSRKLLDIAGSLKDYQCSGCSNADDRTLVEDTTIFPHSAVGQLVGDDPDQLACTKGNICFVQCTGTLISPRHVLTAAHCVYDLKTKQVIRSNNFAAGLSGKRKPFGQVRWTSIHLLGEYVGNVNYTPQAMNYDFALVTLESDVSEKAFHFTLHKGQGRENVSLLQTAGYPVGKEPDGMMWDAKCKNVFFDYAGSELKCDGTGCANLVNHTCITSEGQSGSAFWDDKNSVRAILTGKITPDDGGQVGTNTAVEVNSQVYEVITHWYNDDPAASRHAVNASLYIEPDCGSFWCHRFPLQGPVLFACISAVTLAALACVCAIALPCCRRSTAAPHKAPPPDVQLNPVHLWEQHLQSVGALAPRGSGVPAAARSSLSKQASQLAAALSRRMSAQREPSELEESLIAPGASSSSESRGPSGEEPALSRQASSLVGPLSRRMSLRRQPSRYGGESLVGGDIESDEEEGPL